VLGVTALAAVATGSAAEQAKAAPIKAAWIYVGPTTDGGWTTAHDNGRKYVQKMLGAKVLTTYKENIPPGPKLAQTVASLVRDGNKIIFATSDDRQEARREVPRRVLRAGDRNRPVEEPGRVLRCG
jgi:simple sugar transport system substrate-binding protein